MKTPAAAVKDRPALGSVLAGLTVVCHFLVTLKWSKLDLARRAAHATDIVSVYTAFAGVAALVAGFVGVLIVFATLTGGAWSRVRDMAGRPLIKNWISPMRVTFVAAFSSVVASFITQIGHSIVGWWIFEAAVVLTVSAVLRILWLLSGLLRVQQNVDHAASQEANRVDLKDLGLAEPPAES